MRTGLPAGGAGAGAGAGAGGLPRPGTAHRLGTGMRMGTSAGAHIAGAVGPMAEVSITDRPVTAQGLAARRLTTAGGTTRMVQDASYFVGVLRQKINEVSGEIARMRADTERLTKEASVMGQFERKYETVMKEVRSLEGDLADYNLAMDKARTSMDASEIAGYHTALRRRNEATSREVDSVFIERQEREKGAARLEQQIGELHGAMEARINTLAPPLIAEYRALTEENRGLAGTIARYQEDLLVLNKRVEEAEAVLKRDRVRDEYALLEKRLAHLRRERSSLEEEAAATRLDPTEGRERFVAKVKDDNSRLQAVEAQLRAVTEEIGKRKKTIAEVTAELEERRGEAGDSAKYELLFRRDQEMTEYIDRYPELKEREMAEHRRIQNTVAALLEHISEGMEREKSMPDRATAMDMKDDLSDKTRELKASQMTAERLQTMLRQRQDELDKVTSLDARVAAELKLHTERIATMREEMRRYADLDGLRSTAAAVRADLEARIAEYGRRRDMMRQQVQLLSADYDKRKAALARDPTANALAEVEAKIKTHEQNVFALREFIATKGREADYEPLRKECLHLMAELNTLIQRAQLAMPEATVGGVALAAVAGTGVGGM